MDGGTSQTTSLPPGSVFLYSSREFIWSRWLEPTECIHMAIAPNLLNSVAADCSVSGDVEIDYRVMFADPTIVHLAQLFKSAMLSHDAFRLETERAKESIGDRAIAIVIR